ncbi:MAG: AraC family transcriptional regulator [Gammaproteobacteria bacterium]|nr:AraC family transcriptional regulator [Gammaproteobacteria bacterium]
MHKSKEFYRAKIELAQRYIEQHTHQAISLSEIADSACFSEYHFHRLFVAVVGETPNHYQNRMRLEKAANKLLFHRSENLTEIALSCGFQSSSSFSRAFRQHFGVAPSVWRGEKSKIGQADVPTRGDNVAYAGAQQDEAVYDVALCTLSALQIAYVATREGYAAQGIAQAWRALLTWAGQRKLVSDKAQYISIAFDNPSVTLRNRCRYFAGLSVDHTAVDRGRGSPVGYYSLPGGTYAVLRYAGKIADIDRAYQYLYREWLLNSDYQPADTPVYERLQTLGPDEAGGIKTEICLPVKKIQCVF